MVAAEDIMLADIMLIIDVFIFIFVSVEYSKDRLFF